jgi:3-oxoacyl-[acyl-carrier protein] reductase
MPDPSDRVVVVTGAGHGIGARIAEAFGTSGARVALFDLDGAAARSVAERIGAAALAMTVDVTDEQAVQAAMARVVAAFGGLDVLVNNAAVTASRQPDWFGGPVLDLPVAQWRRVLDVNLTAAFICAQQAARLMRERGGQIVNIASVQGIRPTKGSIDYATSKAGLIMLTHCLAGELAPYRIRVNAVAPGPIALDHANEPGSSGTLTGVWGTPGDVANAVLFLASAEAHYINGHVLVVDDGTSIAPREAPRRVHPPDVAG